MREHAARFQKTALRFSRISSSRGNFVAISSRGSEEEHSEKNTLTAWVYPDLTIFLIRVLGFLMGLSPRLIVAYPRLIRLLGRLPFDSHVLPLLWMVLAGQRSARKSRPQGRNGCFSLSCPSFPAGVTRLEGASGIEGVEGPERGQSPQRAF